MAQNQSQNQAASKGVKVARVVSTKVVTKAARVVSRVAVVVGVPNSKSGPKPSWRSSEQPARRSRHNQR